jgi:hypothetical protein
VSRARRREEAQLRETEFLGQRLLRLDRRSERSAMREHIENKEQDRKRLDQLNCGAHRRLQTARTIGAASALPTAASTLTLLFVC